MASIQTRLSDHVDIFYGAADRMSDGAMAANAYKRSVEELDSVMNRELVCTIHLVYFCLLITLHSYVHWILRTHRTELPSWNRLVR
jgi:hypothetical protein